MKALISSRGNVCCETPCSRRFSSQKCSMSCIFRGKRSTPTNFDTFTSSAVARSSSTVLKVWCSATP
eukprot:4413479-Pyramimonas_sp.AAC.1